MNRAKVGLKNGFTLAVLNFNGSLFHKNGPERVKAPSPNISKLVLGIFRKLKMAAVRKGSQLGRLINSFQSFLMSLIT